MKTQLFYFFALLFVCTTAQAQVSPGGVSIDLSYWLKADSGITLSSGSVSAWADQTPSSSNSVTQASSSQRPLPVASALNFNPGVFFDGNNDRLSTNSGYASSTQILVFNPTKTISPSVFIEIVLAYDLPGAAFADAGIGVGNFSGAPCANGYFLSSGDNDATSPEYLACLDDASFSSDEPFLATVRQNVAGTNTEHRLWGEDMNPMISNQSEYGVFTNRPFTIGQRNGGGIEYEGDILEVISYSSRVSDTDLNKIESYLAIKYGITLDQGMAQDYLNSLGASIYDADDVLDVFDANIAGIGRDDLSGLNQKQSSSIHSGALVTMGLDAIAIDNVSNTGSFAANLNFMLWGNNSETTTFGTSVPTLCGTLNRMQRIWAVEETGTVGTVEISIPQSAFGANSPTLLISTDTTFDRADALVRLTDDGSGNYSAMMDFEDGSYFTFGELSNSKITEYTGGSWNNGVPTITSIARIQQSYNTSIANINACSCEITNNATLIVAAGDYMNIDKNITVEAGSSLIVQHTGSVVQVDDAARVIGAGSISVLVDTPNLDVRDFMILGSPMTAETREGVWDAAWNVQNYTPANFNPVAAVTDAYNFADAELDDWNLYVTGALDAGEGFLVRPQTSLNGAGGVFSYDYKTGFLTNGVVTRPLNFNTEQLDSPNMLSNPYASAIDADLFLAANSEIDAVYFWEHILAPDPSFPGVSTTGPNYSMGDISFYNALGGIGSASGSAIPTNVISTSQGFGTFANATGTATFNNSMRLISRNNTLRSTAVNRDRLWLHITSDVYNVGGTTLVGFTEMATEGFDRKYDSQRMATHVSIFSHIYGDETGYAVQGREVFDPATEIFMGFSSIIEEVTSYTISLSNFDGIAWETNTPYLEDTETGIITNLNEGSYSFTSDKGTFNTRFILRFTDRNVLDISEVSLQQITVSPNPTEGVLNIQSPLSVIRSISVKDIQGRTVAQMDAIEALSLTIDISEMSSAVYFLNIETDKGTIIKRVIKE